jgi:transposase
MAMGRRERTRQQEIFIETTGLRTPGHPFYERLNAILNDHGFDDFVEQLCATFYDERQGRPSIAPGVYFRMMLIGYFEGIDSERGIAWRSADSLALRGFLGFELNQSPPDHSSVSRTRRRLDLETHQQVFQWILGVLGKEDLVEGKTVGIDATTLEANAALRSIVRRDSGQSYQEYLNGLAKASGIPTPTRKDRAKVDKKRPKKGSNDDWQHPKDPDARITKMKNGRTHLAHKVEHAVDMNSGAVVAVTVQDATLGDTQTVDKTIEEAHHNLAGLDEDDRQDRNRLRELVLDRGYHSNATMTFLRAEGIRGYVAEPDRGRRRWKGKREAQMATYANRRRIRGERGKALQRKRGELLERAFAHCLETGAMRRVHLRHADNIRKRVLIHVGAFNLSLIMRKTLGHGTPRGLPKLMIQLVLKLRTLTSSLRQIITQSPDLNISLEMASATGC